MAFWLWRQCGVAVGLDGMVDHESNRLLRALFLPFAPTITLFARVLWIYFDRPSIRNSLESRSAPSP